MPLKISGLGSRILVLTNGLGDNYDKLIVNLNATLSDQLTLDYVITRLLNEESHQHGMDTSLDPDDSSSPHGLAAWSKSHHKRSKMKVTKCIPNVKCHNCGGRGHYAQSCPTPQDDKDDDKDDDKAAAAAGAHVVEESSDSEMAF